MYFTQDYSEISKPCVECGNGISLISQEKYENRKKNLAFQTTLQMRPNDYRIVRKGKKKSKSSSLIRN